MIDQERIVLRFNSLLEQADELCSIYADAPRAADGGVNMPGDKYFKWYAAARHLLNSVAAGKSAYTEECDLIRGANPSIGRGILEAAKEAFVDGWLADTKLLLSAEIFSDFLDQATHLIDLGYKDAAAVLIGAVLEDGLRKLCDSHGIAIPAKATIAPLSELLYKQDVYGLMVHKEILAKSDLRNNAAHGMFDQYGIDDVKAFLEFVGRFLAEYLK
jgi:hypothetical protein